MTRFRAAIVGATGMAGQQFVLALSGHPLFEVVEMVTSRACRDYEAALRDVDGSSRWMLDVDIPADMRFLPVVDSEHFRPELFDVIFTAVESDLALVLEPKFAHTTPTFSTASAFRYEADTPLLVAGVNDNLADVVRLQQRRRNWRGFVLPIPNCTVTGLAIALSPLHLRWGVEKVLMVSMQAVSGAGRSPGVRTLDSLDNIIPYIPQEEDKVRRELKKILGVWQGERHTPADMQVNCLCTRAAVLDGHFEAVFVGLREPATAQEVGSYLSAHHPLRDRHLPSAPQEWIHVFADPYRPQVRLDRNRGDGMTTSIGRLEDDPVLGGVKFALVSHNTRFGAGKGAVLLAESAVEQGVLDR